MFTSLGQAPTPTREQFLDSLVIVNPKDIPSEQDTCPICCTEYEVDPNSPVRASTCPHFFHRECVNGWVYNGNGNTCPMCRQRWCKKEVSDESVIDDDESDTETDDTIAAFTEIIGRFNPYADLNNSADVQQIYAILDELYALTSRPNWTEELHAAFDAFVDGVRFTLDNFRSGDRLSEIMQFVLADEVPGRDPRSQGYPRPAPDAADLPQGRRTLPVSEDFPAARDTRFYPFEPALEDMGQDDVTRNLRVWELSVVPDTMSEWITIRADGFDLSFASLVNEWLYRQGRWPNAESTLLRSMHDYLVQWAWMHDGQVWQIGQIHDVFMGLAERVFVNCGYTRTDMDAEMRIDGVPMSIFSIFKGLMFDAFGAMLCFRLVREIEVFGHLLPGPAYEKRYGIWGEVEDGVWTRLE